MWAAKFRDAWTWLSKEIEKLAQGFFWDFLYIFWNTEYRWSLPLKSIHRRGRSAAAGE